MTQDVKEFIEDNIKLIEQGRFEDLYKLWYNVEAYGKRYKDQSRVQELITVLSDANVSRASDTYDIRKNILEQKIEDILTDWMDDIPWQIESTGWISNKYISDERLESGLGIHISEIDKIIEKVATSKGLLPEGDGWRHKDYV